MTLYLTHVRLTDTLKLLPPPTATTDKSVVQKLRRQVLQRN